MKFNKDNQTIISIAIITLTVILTGGMPLSSVVYYIIEHKYDVKMPSYNINYNLSLIDNYKAEKKMLNEMKVDVNSSTKLQNIMNSRNIYMKEIVTKDASVIKYRIDGYLQINDYFRVLDNLKISNMEIKSTLLNEEELIVSIKKTE